MKSTPFAFRQRSQPETPAGHSLSPALFPHPPPRFRRSPSGRAAPHRALALCRRSSYLRGPSLSVPPGPQGHGHARGAVPGAAGTGTGTRSRRHRPAPAAAPGPPPTRPLAQALCAAPPLPRSPQRPSRCRCRCRAIPGIAGRRAAAACLLWASRANAAGTALSARLGRCQRLGTPGALVAVTELCPFSLFTGMLNRRGFGFFGAAGELRECGHHSICMAGAPQQPSLTSSLDVSMEDVPARGGRWSQRIFKVPSTRTLLCFRGSVVFSTSLQ